MTTTITPRPRDQVITSLGPDWPPHPGAVLVRLAPTSGITDGAVTVYETPGRPGTTWWLIDGAIPPQGAGPGGEPLAALIPGAVTDTVPDLAPDSPPVT